MSHAACLWSGLAGPIIDRIAACCGMVCLSRNPFAARLWRISAAFCGKSSRFQPGHLCWASVGGSRSLPVFTVSSMVRFYDTDSAAQAGSGGIAGVVLARLGSDAVFLVADVGADHTFQLPAAAQHQMQE